LDPWIEGYLDYLTDVRRQSAGTVRDVRCTLRRVSTIMADQRPGVPLWQLTLNDYIQWLDQERTLGRSPRSLGKNLSHLRGLLDYAWRCGRADRNVLDGFTLQDAYVSEPPGVLTVEEAQRLVEACPQDTPADRADRVMVLLFYGCGLRTGELCNLNVQHINREQRSVFVAHGKGDRQRYVPIPDSVYTEVLAYLLDRGGKRGPLFRTPAKGARMTVQLASRIVQAAAARAKIGRPVTPKTLRHSFATHLMDRGVDLAVIASLMGHRSPAESGVYLHVLPHRPREAVNQLDRRDHGEEA
jgi:integrase/recombinase XerD